MSTINQIIYNPQLTGQTGRRPKYFLVKDVVKHLGIKDENILLETVPKSCYKTETLQGVDYLLISEQGVFLAVMRAPGIDSVKDMRDELLQRLELFEKMKLSTVSLKELNEEYERELQEWCVTNEPYKTRHEKAQRLFYDATIAWGTLSTRQIMPQDEKDHKYLAKTLRKLIAHLIMWVEELDRRYD